MRDFTETNLTEEVIARMSGETEPRLQQIMTALIRHMHDFVREVELSEAEWFAAIQFLTDVGQKCDGKRQEFILLSDTLGVSMLVDAISHRKAKGATESTVFGPFYRDNAMLIEQGGSIAGNTPGEPCVMAGGVLCEACSQIAGALLYTQYNFVRRFLIRQGAKRAGTPIDVTRDRYCTDWPALD